MHLQLFFLFFLFFFLFFPLNAVSVSNQPLLRKQFTMQLSSNCFKKQKNV